MPSAHTMQPTARARLAGVSRVDLGDHHADFLSLALSSLANEVPLPLPQSPSGGFAFDRATPRLREAQSLEHEHGVGWGEGHRLFRRRLGEGARAVGTLATKPFEQSAHTVRLPALCLTGRKFTLQALAHLEIALIAH